MNLQIDLIIYIKIYGVYFVQTKNYVIMKNVSTVLINHLLLILKVNFGVLIII